MYSPASQKLLVGSTVMKYVIRAIKKTTHPKMVSHFSKFFENIYCNLTYGANLRIHNNMTTDFCQSFNS